MKLPPKPNKTTKKLCSFRNRAFSFSSPFPDGYSGYSSHFSPPYLFSFSPIRAIAQMPESNHLAASVNKANAAFLIFYYYTSSSTNCNHICNLLLPASPFLSGQTKLPPHV
jgi:hypothetical protein